MVYVIKFDGSRQKFDRSKIERTCLRMHASPEAARRVAEFVESRAYDGISTKKIMQMVFSGIRREKPEYRHVNDLRSAISALRPKPDFEKFIAQLLRAYGYKIITNAIVNGKCVDHEIDVIAEKGGEVLYVEVKHHYKPHTFTGMGHFLEAQATFEDLVDGYKTRSTGKRFSKALLVSNTKLSEHARRYADCRGIAYIGWNAPKDSGLESMIEEKKLYPITMIKGLSVDEEAALGDASVVTVGQILKYGTGELAKKTGISNSRMKEIKQKCEHILSISGSSKN